MTEKALKITRILFILYLIAVALLCFLRMGNLPHVEDNVLGLPIDKVVHFLMFLPFPILSFFSFGTFFCNKEFTLISVLSLIGMCFAGATEIIQGFIKYRDADILDFYADAAGIIIGSAIVIAMTSYRKNHFTQDSSND